MGTLTDWHAYTCGHKQAAVDCGCVPALRFFWVLQVWAVRGFRCWNFRCVAALLSCALGCGCALRGASGYRDFCWGLPPVERSRGLGYDPALLPACLPALRLWGAADVGLRGALGCRDFRCVVALLHCADGVPRVFGV